MWPIIRGYRMKQKADAKDSEKSKVHKIGYILATKFLKKMFCVSMGQKHTAFVNQQPDGGHML